jgi:hypothetical protein
VTQRRLKPSRGSSAETAEGLDRLGARGCGSGVDLDY